MNALPLFALLSFPQIWLSIPLAVAFAFCYSASRTESTREIIKRALRILGALAFFMVLIAVILFLAV
ncbi:MAG: hypothetical protein IJU03_08600 [Thermoguttaceae bacterium]|jgi:hypothetical protein|nr:hypothetical protein [Thermoguttaceae bacterium]